MMNLWTNVNKDPVQATLERQLDRYGHYAVYRKYDTSRPADDLNQTTLEGGDGARYEYTDYIVVIRHDRNNVTSSTGNATTRGKIHCKSKITPKKGDVVIELDYAGPKSMLTDSKIRALKHRIAFTIEDYTAQRGKDGQIVLYTLLVRPELGDY